MEYLLATIRRSVRVDRDYVGVALQAQRVQLARLTPWRPVERADERRGDEDAGLAEREVVAVAQERRHHGDAEPDRRVRRLRERAGREDGPAVPRRGYSPNGFVGRDPVYVTTDFVSR